MQSPSIFPKIDPLKHIELKDIISDINIIDLIFAGIFLISLLAQLIYYLFIFSRASRKSPELNPRIRKYPPVSVIICARNEASNLEEKLPAILNQDYPEFEVVVVDDRSGDNSWELLEAFRRKYKNLKTTRVTGDPKLVRGKKLALTLGIKSASHPILLHTDADCIPASKSWIRYMARNYKSDKALVLGIGLYKKRKGLLNLFIRFETAFIAMQYISLARMSRSYMGVGRNLSYKKEIFFAHKGFASHLELDSGDDDLFVNEISNRNNTAIETHPLSFTYSEPETQVAAWLKQKKRHLTTSRHYQGNSKRILGGEYFSRMLLLISFILLIINFDYKLPVIIAFTFLILIKGIIFKIAFNRLHEKFLFLPAIIIEPFIPWIYGFLHIINFIERKRYRWQ